MQIEEGWWHQSHQERVATEQQPIPQQPLQLIRHIGNCIVPAARAAPQPWVLPFQKHLALSWIYAQKHLALGTKVNKLTCNGLAAVMAASTAATAITQQCTGKKNACEGCILSCLFCLNRESHWWTQSKHLHEEALNSSQQVKLLCATSVPSLKMTWALVNTASSVLCTNKWHEHWWRLFLNLQPAFLQETGGWEQRFHIENGNLHSVALSLPEEDISSGINSLGVQLSPQILQERLRLPVCSTGQQ